MKPKETEEPEGQRQERKQTQGLTCLCGLPPEMTYLLSAAAKWHQEDTKG